MAGNRLSETLPPLQRWTGAQIEREDLFTTSGATPGETAPSRDRYLAMRPAKKNFITRERSVIDLRNLYTMEFAVYRRATAGVEE